MLVISLSLEKTHMHIEIYPRKYIIAAVTFLHELNNSFLDEYIVAVKCRQIT